jgi:acyl-CoA thioesterase FadM
MPIKVSFGDCDPADIVFYPNFFRWFDATFHDFLWRFGGHQAICHRLNAKGVGLIEVDAKFRKPAVSGDTLQISFEAESTHPKTLSVAYKVHRGDTLIATGHETRGLFVMGETGMMAGDIAPLTLILKGEDHPLQT